jgi:carbon-monoxide dehydrogenase small subunit
MAAGKNITTIAGVASEDGELPPLQQAFIEVGAIQCGYCTPGMILTSLALLNENPNPTLEDVKVALSGNLCRLYRIFKIFDAVMSPPRECGRKTLHNHTFPPPTDTAKAWRLS